MTETRTASLDPIRSVVMKHFERLCLAARSLTPLVRIEEHSYDWGVSWSVSALANSASDEAVASVVVQTRSNIAELEADIAYANAPLSSLAPLRFSTDDPHGISAVAETVDKFLQSSVLCFTQCCQRMMDDASSGERQ